MKLQIDLMAIYKEHINNYKLNNYKLNDIVLPQEPNREDLARLYEHELESILSERELTMVRMKYGLSPYDRSYTFKEIALVSNNTINGQCGISRARVCQIVYSAMCAVRSDVVDLIMFLCDRKEVLSEKNRNGLDDDYEKEYEEYQDGPDTHRVEDEHR